MSWVGASAPRLAVFHSVIPFFLSLLPNQHVERQLCECFKDSDPAVCCYMPSLIMQVACYLEKVRIQSNHVKA